MEIIGSRLKFDPKDDEQGVFAVLGTKTVRCASVVENKPARIIVLLDASVPAGDFTLEVRTKLSSDGSKKSKTLKKGYYRKTLKGRNAECADGNAPKSLISCILAFIIYAISPKVSV